MKKKVLVTGANGQLGQSIQALAHNYTNELDFVFASSDILDISNKKTINQFFNSNTFDYCINCAAYTAVDHAEDDPEQAHLVNAESVKRLAQTCLAYSTILIHISTDFVFDGSKEAPYTESDPTHPLNVYGKTKRLGEQYITKYMDKYYIIRTSWLYSKFGKNFVKTIFDKLQHDEKLNIVSSQRGTPTSCEDLSLFILHLISHNITKYGLYHFSAEGQTTWYDLALHIAKHIGKTDNIKPVKAYPLPAQRPLYSVLSNEKAAIICKSCIKDWHKSVDRVVEDLLKLNVSHN